MEIKDYAVTKYMLYVVITLHTDIKEKVKTAIIKINANVIIILLSTYLRKVKTELVFCQRDNLFFGQVTKD